MNPGVLDSSSQAKPSRYSIPGIVRNYKELVEFQKSYEAL